MPDAIEEARPKPRAKRRKKYRRGVPKGTRIKRLSETVGPTMAVLEGLANTAEKLLDCKPAVADAAFKLLELITDSYPMKVAKVERLARRIKRARGEWSGGRTNRTRTTHKASHAAMQNDNDGSWDNVVRAFEDQ